MAKNGKNMGRALGYIARRDLSPAKSSTLRKLIRGARIAAGLRPDRVKRRKMLPVGVYGNRASGRVLVMKPFDLHPTKGFRSVPGGKLVFRLLDESVTPPAAVDLAA